MEEKKKDFNFNPEMDLFKMAEQLRKKERLQVTKKKEEPTEEEIKYRAWRRGKKRLARASQQTNRNKKKHRKKRGRVKADG